MWCWELMGKAERVTDAGDLQKVLDIPWQMTERLAWWCSWWAQQATFICKQSRHPKLCAQHPHMGPREISHFHEFAKCPEGV